MKNKTYRLTVKHSSSPPRPLDLTLTPPNQWGYCSKCHLKKEIRVISERPIGISWEEKKFCSACALTDLEELEGSDCKFENKKEVIKELRTVLLENKPSPSPGEELLECYE